MSNKILILGGGQMGGALAAQLGDNAILFHRGDCDLQNPHFVDILDAALQRESFAAVINAAAYTAVDKAENEGKAEAFRTNTEAVGELAGWCAQQHLPLVHFSTDYVFPGHGSHAQRERDGVGPVNAYGESKLAGERLLQLLGGDHLIFRINWVYESAGKNFFTTMRRLMKEKDELAIVADQFGAPGYAPFLAKAALSALSQAQMMHIFPTGIYHLALQGETSWHGFAEAILAEERKRTPNLRCNRILPIPSAEYPTPAMRPHNSRLNTGKLRETFEIDLPSWQEGLAACYQKLQ